MKTICKSSAFIAVFVSFFSMSVCSQNSDMPEAVKKALKNMSGFINVQNSTLVVKDSTIDVSLPDQSVALVGKDGNLTLQKCILKKSSGHVTNKDACLQYGLNSCILVNGENAKVNIDNVAIKADAMGAGAVFAANAGTMVNIKNLTLRSIMGGSRGLVAVQGAQIVADGVDLSTLGVQCAAVSAEQTQSSITVKNGTLNTSGMNSPTIFASGKINVQDAVIQSLVSECAVIDGGGEISISNSSFSSGNDNIFFVYQSGEGEKSESKLSIRSGSLDVGSATLFYATNINTQIEMKGVHMLNLKKKSILLNATADKWGKRGENGANVELLLTDQEITGQILCDNQSSCKVQLSKQTIWTGAINAKQSSKSAGVALDETAQWILTSHVYLSEFSDAKADLSNINSQGFNIYYDKSNPANAWLNGETRALKEGGKLIAK